MTAGAQSVGDAWLLMAHDVRCEVLRVPSVFQQGHHGLSDRVEDLIAGEPENLFQIQDGIAGRIRSSHRHAPGDHKAVQPPSQPRRSS